LVANGDNLKCFSVFSADFYTRIKMKKSRLFYTVMCSYNEGAVGMLRTVRFREVSGLSSFGNIYNQATGCEAIAYCVVLYFILSHPACANIQNNSKSNISI